MRKLIGILLIILFTQQAVSYAQESDLSLKNNLSIKLDSSKTTTKNVVAAVKEDKIKPVNVEEKAIDKSLNIVLIPQVQVRPDGIIYQESQREISVLNPKKNVNTNNNYPGLRGPNQLIVYTPAFGLRTGTNEFGTEAIVENNMVVRLNGADSIIPKNGFVISGHGSAKNWIIQNIQVGSKVYLDFSNKTIRVYLTPESLLFAAKEKIKEVHSLIEYYRHLDILYNDKKANEYLTLSKDSLRKAKKKPEKTQVFINEAMNSLDSAIKNAIPFMQGELKGVWLRPVEKNQQEIEKTLSRLNSAGITDIFLETYFHGKTIYPSRFLKRCGVIPQREEFVGFDPLELWIQGAHKRNMKVHVWFETFYVGNDKPQTTPKHVLNVYPTWANKRLYNYDSPEPVPSLSEHNGYFLDPSNMHVQMYLMGILTEIVNQYKPDGINLDYIRYPQTVEPTYSNYVSMNWGYTKNARDDFKFQYGVDPIDIKYGTPDWDKWAEYRQSQITKFLISAKKLAKSNNILLTAVIFPDLNKCMSTKMQNWRLWSLNNYVDGLTPLILTGDKNTADMLLRDIIKNTNSSTNIYPGLFVTFMGGSMDDLLLQIHKTREYKTKGAILFDYAHLNDKYIQALMTRAFNQEYEPKENKPKFEEPVQTLNKTQETKKKKRRRRK